MLVAVRHQFTPIIALGGASAGSENLIRSLPLFLVNVVGCQMGLGGHRPTIQHNRRLYLSCSSNTL
jgi:hypothetical protein